jgi:hypothetical protein
VMYSNVVVCGFTPYTSSHWDTGSTVEIKERYAGRV